MSNHTRTRRARLITGTVALAAVLLGVGGAAGAQPAPSAPATHNQADPQNGEADSNFGGYIGVSESSAGASAVAGPDDPASKPPDEAAVHNPPGRVDVAGEAASTAAVEDDSLTQLVAPDAAQGDSAATLQAAVAQSGTVRVIITTNLAVKTEASLSPAAVDAQRGAIDSALTTVDSALSGTGSRVITRFEVVPAAVAEVDQAGLAALLANPAITSVTIDGEAPMALDVSTGVIDSDQLNAAGVDGRNYEGSTTGPYEVAILDTGVDNGHNAVGGHIVAQACFSANAQCPNGLTFQFGGNAGDDCVFSAGCDHGTHVAGIAAGLSYPGGHFGVAGGAGIVAIQIGHSSTSCGAGESNPCWRYFFSDLDLALQHTLNLRNAGRNIAAVNMSLGGPLFADSAACGVAFPNTQNLAANLQAAGVAFVAAAGNNGSTTQTSYPGCLPSAFTVGATDDFDTPASFTNSNASLDWWAPGVGIASSVPTGNNTGSKSGTSMATPHVVGAFALLRECIGNSTPGAVAADLSATGVSVTRGGITRQRINVLDAATRNVNNNDFAFPEVIPAAGFDDYDFNVCADFEAGEPGPFSLDNSIWWTWTPSATGTANISTEDGGGNVTTFDTTLSVYTGNALNALNLVASDDDSGTGTRSLVVFPVNAGVTYRIKVDGFAAQNGELNLHVANGPPPTCFGAPATIVGTTGNDVLNGTAGPDVIVAGDGNDGIRGLGGNDTICGDSGDDTILGGTENDFVLGGPGADTINGEAGADTLVGNAGGGDINDGNDSIIGGADNDFLDGWVGNDVLQGGDGDDTLLGAAGTDTATYFNAPNAIVADITANTATGQGTDSLGGIENLTGSEFNDRLVGNGGNNVLTGRGGNDIISGKAGNDTVDGRAGNDVLYGGLGNDRVIGDTGADAARYDDAAVGVTVNLAAGTSTGQGNDLLVTIENATGSAFNDVLFGNAGANTLNGLAGPDFIRGSDGNDGLNGGTGNDDLGGEAGNDIVNGNDGGDALNGGVGTDNCNGGLGPDTGVSCEVSVGIP